MVEDRDPRHMVCELRSALVPVALIFSPLVEQVLGVKSGKPGAASPNGVTFIDRHGLVDRLKPASRFSSHLEGSSVEGCAVTVQRFSFKTRWFITFTLNTFAPG